MDLLLQYVDPLRELGGRQLLFLVVAGAKRRTPPATGEIHSNSVNFPLGGPLPTAGRHAEPRRVFLPDKRVRVRRRGRHFRIVQVLLALSVGVEAGGQHRVAVLLQQLADQAPPTGVGGQPGLLPVHALPLQRRVRWDRF